MKVTVQLFKPSGKYYTEEQWEVPDTAIGPYMVENSPDFRRIGDGPVLVPSQEPWGYPFLFPSPSASSTYQKGEGVRKKSGSEWSGKVVGHYSTRLNPDGICVESDMHAGSVQIYPASALEYRP